MEKNDLLDTVFLLLVSFDTMERLENTVHTVNYLHGNFDTHIYLWEVSSHNNGLLKRLIPQDVSYHFLQDYDPILHRTHYLNEMVKSAEEKFVAVWDVDVVVPVNQVLSSMSLLRQGCDFVYPYDAKFLDTTEGLRMMYLEENGNMELLEEYKDFMLSLYAPNPVGGAFFANRASYIDSGLENEAFYGWGLEDGERYNRWTNLGYDIGRVSGDIFHLSHPRLVNSRMQSRDMDILKKRELVSSMKRTLWEKY